LADGWTQLPETLENPELVVDAFATYPAQFSLAASWPAGAAGERQYWQRACNSQ